MLLVDGVFIMCMYGYVYEMVCTSFLEFLTGRGYNSSNNERVYIFVCEFITVYHLLTFMQKLQTCLAALERFTVNEHQKSKF